MHLLRILNHLDRSHFRLSLALARSGGTYEPVLADDVRVHILNTGTINSSTIRMVRSIGPLRKIIDTERPDILCSVMDIANIIAVLASRTLLIRPKLVLIVQNAPLESYKRTWRIVDRLILLLIPRLYPQADQVIALSQGVARDLIALVPKMSEPPEVISNVGVDAIVLEGAREALPEGELPQNGPLIVACGRLTEQKGFPYLIHALVGVRKVLPANLWIIGEGEQRPSLEKKIQQLGLNDCVRLLGFQQNPFKYMAAADVFVLSSIFEGFGNVIVEAMACGTPVIATDCPYGPAEIIRDGVNGILVPIANSAALAQGIIRVLTNAALKQQLSQEGKARSQNFDAHTIATAYGNLLQRVVNR